MHGVVFDILVFGTGSAFRQSRKSPQAPQRKGFFNSEKRSGSSPSDGWSIGLLLREIADGYQGMLSSQPAGSPEVRLTHRHGSQPRAVDQIDIPKIEDDL